MQITVNNIIIIRFRLQSLMTYSDCHAQQHAIYYHHLLFLWHNTWSKTRLTQYNYRIRIVSDLMKYKITNDKRNWYYFAQIIEVDWATSNSFNFLLGRGKNNRKLKPEKSSSVRAKSLFQQGSPKHVFLLVFLLMFVSTSYIVRLLFKSTRVGSCTLPPYHGPGGARRRRCTVDILTGFFFIKKAVLTKIATFGHAI